MTTRLYVGNLNFETTEDTLRQALAGEDRTVTKVDIVTDNSSGRPRGFAFVDLSSEEEAKAAMDALDGTELDGRPIKVHAAKERNVRVGGFGTSGGNDYGGELRRLPPRRWRRRRSAPPVGSGLSSLASLVSPPAMQRATLPASCALCARTRERGTRRPYCWAAHFP